MLYGLAGLPHHYPLRGLGSSPPYCGSVRDLQQKLQNVGLYQGTVDGQWGPKTQSAAQQFAQQHGISVSGGISQAYCNALDAAQGGGSPAPSSSSSTTSGGGGGGGEQSLAEQTEGSSVTPDQGVGSGGWWSSQSTGVKVAIVGGGVIVLGLVGLMVFGGKKAPAPVMVKNRRRRRARR